LKKIEERSPIALEATLKLLRYATKNDYYDTLKEELKVAKNIILYNDDFNVSMENKINNNKNVGKKFSNNSFSGENFQNKINKIFENNEIKNIKLDVKPHSMLPNKDYLYKYPDCFRIWINEHRNAVYPVRKFFDYEIKNFMIQKL
jgi:hypothetical protein